MSMLFLPIRIRPNRVRLLTYNCVLSAIGIPALFLLLDHWHQVEPLLASPQATMEFASAVLACVFVAVFLLLIAAFALAALPGAPFLYVDIDERCVTHRRLWSVQRKVLRDVDGWTTQERRRSVVRHGVRFYLFSHFVVAKPQGLDPRRVRKAVGQLLEFDTDFFTPLFADKIHFTETFAACLSDAVEAVRQSRRPVLLELPHQIAAQAFELVARAEPAATAEHATTAQPKAKQRPARSPGRFPTNEDKANYWRNEATQAARASDDSPEEARASERAYLYGELAKRDRKRIARERRASRLRARSHKSEDT